MEKSKFINITLKDQEDRPTKLSDFKGQWLILYFYPKDNTPGCTIEACEFRDIAQELVNANAQIIGVSKDSITSHQKFIAKHKLNFTLLVDTDAELARAFDSYGLKKFMGREYMGFHRNTFILNPDGDIVKSYHDVKPLGHAKTVLDDLISLQKA